MATPQSTRTLINKVVTNASYTANQMRPVLTYLNPFWKSATTNPTANDDSTLGFYAFKSFWRNSSSGNLYLCIDDTVGAAAWTLVSGASGTVPGFYLSTGEPTSSDDSSLGYLPGSIGYSTDTERVFLCIDSTVNNAVWVLVSTDKGFESVALVNESEIQLNETTSGFILTGSVNECVIKLPANSYIGKMVTGRLTGSVSGELVFANSSGDSISGDTGESGDSYVFMATSSTTWALVGFSRLP